MFCRQWSNDLCSWNVVIVFADWRWCHWSSSRRAWQQPCYLVPRMGAYEWQKSIIFVRDAQSSQLFRRNKYLLPMKPKSFKTEWEIRYLQAPKNAMQARWRKNAAWSRSKYSKTFSSFCSLTCSLNCVLICRGSSRRTVYAPNVLI